MSIRKFLRLAAVGPLLAVIRDLGLLASYGALGEPVKVAALGWTVSGCLWWGLTLPAIVYWSERDPLVPGGRLRGLLARHLARAVLLSVASGLGIWATRALGTLYWDTDPFTLRQLFSNLFQSWMLFDLFMYAVALCCVSVIAYQRQLRARELEAAQLETTLAQTELRLLKAQLDPHFVFNALHTISALVHRDAEAADRMVCRLSDFLRLSLASTGAQEVTLQQELEHLESYMAVQMVRFRGRLTLELDVPTELLGCSVPNLLLQPLVENVVKHAVAVALRPVRAQVRARRSGEELVIEIDDDGPGLLGGPPREGIGLANTRQRLQKLYGEAHGLRLAGLPERGTRVEVVLPLRGYNGEGAGDEMRGADESSEEVEHVAGLHRR